MQELLIALQHAGLLLPDEQLGTVQDQESVFHDEEIADLLWLADKLDFVAGETEEAPESQASDGDVIVTVEEGDAIAAPASPTVPLLLDSPPPEKKDEEEVKPREGLPIQVRAASALPNRRDLARALRPLMKKVPSLSREALDVTATVNRIAKEDLWWPVMRPVKERWFDLELIVDDSPEAALWQPMVDEFRLVLERQGAFRNVRTWSLGSEASGELYLKVRAQGRLSARSRRPGELVGAAGRRLVLLVSDCSSSMWQQGTVHDWLALWSKAEPTAVLQLLPERLWGQSELDVGHRVQVSNQLAGGPNTKLIHHGYRKRQLPKPEQTLLLPLTMMTPTSLRQWADVVTAVGQRRTPARLFDLDWVGSSERKQRHQQQAKSPKEQVGLFYAKASEPAQILAEAMALFPVSLDVVYLLQDEVFPRQIKPVHVEPVHVAEVYRSGLLKRVVEGKVDDLTEYDFEPEVRDLLYRRLGEDEIFALWDQMSSAVGSALGQESIKSIDALLSPGLEVSSQDKQALRPFAKVMLEVLHRMGGDYAKLAQMVEAEAAGDPDWINPGLSKPDLPVEWKTLEFETEQLLEAGASSGLELQTEQFIVATVEFDDNGLELFKFEAATISKQEQKQGFLRGLFNRQQQAQWVIQKQQASAYRFTQPLAEGVALEMVAVPGGRFLMGSPKDETERLSSEGPEHEVTVSAFFMGRYPVTQAQWRAVAGLEQVERELETEPSNFKGDERPVERVSWEDAQEFCARLSRETGREYRLPSEAEWEYACRAGTTTPFYFGETVTTDLANYDGSSTYGDGPKGEYREKTTEVGQFPANAWGLQDMHGNVWEWCEDDWHENYEGAPDDGSAWIREESEEFRKLLRGGSWYGYPRNCRSAFRFYASPSSRGDDVGFRVACVAPRAV